MLNVRCWMLDVRCSMLTTKSGLYPMASSGRRAVIGTDTAILADIIGKLKAVALFLAQLCRAAGPLDHWSRQGDGTSEYYSGVAYGGGRFVVVGADTNGVSVIVTSSD